MSIPASLCSSSKRFSGQTNGWTEAATRSRDMVAPTVAARVPCLSCLASDFVVLVLSEAVLSEAVLSETVLVLDGCLNGGDADR
jgi:hypothetical protein